MKPFLCRAFVVSLSPAYHDFRPSYLTGVNTWLRSGVPSRRGISRQVRQRISAVLPMPFSPPLPRLNLPGSHSAAKTRKETDRHRPTKGEYDTGDALRNATFDPRSAFARTLRGGERRRSGHLQPKSFEPRPARHVSGTPRAVIKTPMFNPTGASSGRYAAAGRHAFERQRQVVDPKRPRTFSSAPPEEALSEDAAHRYRSGESRVVNFATNGGGGNRTRVRGRTELSVYRRRLHLISPAGRCADTYRRASRSCGLAPPAISAPSVPARFLTPLPGPRAQLGVTRSAIT